jgi:hypothetical protein
MFDPQRDIVHDRQRSKPPGQATQFNGRHSITPRSCQRAFLPDRVHARGGNLVATKNPMPNPWEHARAAAGGLFIARSI